MSTGLSIRHETDEVLQGFKHKEYNIRTVENMILSYFQRVRPECAIESFYTTEIQKKWIDAVLKVFARIQIQCLGCFSPYHQFYFCIEAQPPLTKEDTTERGKKEKLDTNRKLYFEDKINDFVERRDCK